MSMSWRAFVLVAVWLCGDALAQETGGEKPPPAPAPANAEDLLQRMSSLYAPSLQRPPTRAPTGDKEKDNAAIRAQQRWDETVRAFAKAGDDWARAVGDQAPDANGLFYRGVGQVLVARIDAAGARQAHLVTASDALRRYLDGTDAQAAFRTDAEWRLSEALVALGAFDPRLLEEAVPHVRQAVDLLQKDGRHDDAGRIASDALQQLKSLGRSAESASLADAIHAGDADFGASTSTIRLFAVRAKCGPGAKFPKMPALKDADSAPLDLEPAKDRPLLVHFFLTGYLGGLATSFRDVETDVRPLWERWHEKGLRVVGVCMDYEIPKKQLEDLRAKWDEWGKKEKPRDGSLASAREWASAKGIAWPWYWDGTGRNNPLSLALGGVGIERPHVVLVDGDGVIRWDGDAAPTGGAAYPGLEEAIGKLIK
jgi:hypothetical protein